MVKSFLPGMISRRRGRIMAVSSITAKLSFPLASAYTATKFGVDGFMESLYDELCLDNYDDFIKLSTIFPYTINTRKELSEVFDTIEDPTPRMTPEFVAQVAVNRHLKGQRNIIITPEIIHRVVQ
jgi:all-trans-retinol dehydrogenase (NAD+)